MSCRLPASRRIRRAAELCALFTLVLLVAAPSTAAPLLEVQIAFIGDGADARDGAGQGIDEANAQGRFLGQHYTLVTVTGADDLSGINATAVIADISALRVLKLAEAHRQLPILNVSSGDDELRQACEPNLFHTIPSFAMREDAVQQWLRQNPASPATAEAWHPAFKKYAAAQLNKRYRARYERAMTDTAWAAWAAVKLISDTVARVGSADSEVVMASIKSDLAFDGQKGVDMSFRNTGQLRQPLLLVEGGKIVAEAPVRGIVAADNLDSLGLADCLK